MFGLFDKKTQEIMVIRNAQGHIQHTIYNGLSRRSIVGITTQCPSRGITEDGHRFWNLPNDTTLKLVGPDGSQYTVPGGYSLTYICD